MPARTGTRTAAPKIAGDQPTELHKPASHRLVRNVNATLGKQILDITNDSVNRAYSQTACWMITGGKRCRLKDIGIMQTP
jgi:hypothetical protein